MLTTRLVVGKIYKANGDSVKSSKVLFKLLNSSFTYENQIVKSQIIASVDDQGNLYTLDDEGVVIPGVKLWSNENGGIDSHYVCYLPGNESFKFTLPNGTNSIELSVLRQAGIIDQDPGYDMILEYINEYLDSLVIDNSSTTNLKSQLYTTNFAMSALKVVVANNDLLAYADKDTLNHADIVLGVLENAVESGVQTRVITQGIIQDTNFSWQLNKPIFLGNNGTLTQTIPSTGFIKQIAFPLTINKIYVKIEQSFIL